VFNYISYHPPLNPLPSRERKEKQASINGGERKTSFHEGRGKKNKLP